MATPKTIKSKEIFFHGFWLIVNSDNDLVVMAIDSYSSHYRDHNTDIELRQFHKDHAMIRVKPTGDTKNV